MAAEVKDRIIISQFAFSIAWIIFASIAWIINTVSPMSIWGTGLGWFAAICWFVSFCLGIATFVVYVREEQFVVTKKDKQGN